MTTLTFKDIRYIRAALEYEVENLQSMIDQDNAGTLDPPLTDDEGGDMSETMLYDDHLIGMFMGLDSPPVSLRLVPKDDGEEEKKGGTG